jgi:hypothetical protein
MSTQPGTPAEVVILHRDADLALGHAGDLFFVLWIDRTTTEGVRTLTAKFSEFAAKQPRGIGLLTTVAAGAKMPEPDPKAQLATWLHGVGDKVVTSALVFEADGFFAAGIRFVVTTLNMVARQEFPHRAFKSIEEASSWFEWNEPQIGKRFNAARVNEAYRAFRAAAKV